MTDEKKLGELRARIDAIDTQLIELLRQRADVIEEVRGVKGPQTIYIRPGREATMLRHLLKSPMGHIPQGLVHRLWREMIGAFTLQEGNFSVAVALLPGKEGLWDLARDHFGGFTPLHSFKDATAACRAVFAKTHQLAALPLATDRDLDTWWRLLLAHGSDVPRVFYRFPFDGVKSPARLSAPDGLIVGAAIPEETGADRSLLAVEWKEGTQANVLTPVLAELTGVVSHIFTAGGKEPPLSLLELSSFLVGREDTLKPWQAKYKDIILRHKIIGAYPVPLSPKPEIKS